MLQKVQVKIMRWEEKVTKPEGNHSICGNRRWRKDSEELVRVKLNGAEVRSDDWQETNSTKNERQGEQGVNVYSLEMEERPEAELEAVGVQICDIWMGSEQQGRREWIYFTKYTRDCATTQEDEKESRERMLEMTKK